MRILIVTQYYPPEVGATQNRLQYFARSLSAAGHDVTVVTEVPNHPSGVVDPAYRRVLWRRRREDGIHVVRVWIKTSPRKTFWARIAFYLTYAVNATLAALLLAGRKPDVIVATSPPLTAGIPALMLSLLRNVPYVLDLRDLWPTTAVELGEISSPTAIAIARRLESALYRRAARVTIVSNAFRSHLLDHQYPDRRIVFLPNGTVPERFHPVPPDPELRRRLGLDGAFVVGFYGNHGIAQELFGVLDAAAALAGETRIRFLFVGEGPVKALMTERARASGLGNVLFHPEVPQSEVLRYIGLADAAIVPLKKLDLFKTAVPSKLFDFMACAKPVLLQVDGEARHILEDSGAGIFVPPGNSRALSDAILEMARLDAGERESMGRRGAEYVRRHHLRESYASHLRDTLLDVVAEARSR